VAGRKLIIDHKHQRLDPQRPRDGLLGMVGDIALSILSHLESEGCHFDAHILESVCKGYKQAAGDFVQRFHRGLFPRAASGSPPSSGETSSEAANLLSAICYLLFVITT
jgi:hypothetical protein